MPVKYKQLDNEQGSDFYFERSLDLIFSPGCFTVEIDHSGKDVGLPIDDCGEEHYFVGNLVVTDSGTAGHKQENRVTGQQLTITSRKGKETKVFTRTYADGVWSQWRSLARTGMYDNISTPDELLATVDSLVTENTRAKEVEESVKRSAVDISSLACTTGNENVTITANSMDGEVIHSVEIPAATTEKAGVMSAEDKTQLYSTKPYTFVYNTSSLSNGYVDGYVDTYTETITTAIKYMAVSVEEGMQCTLTSVRRNLGYMYIIYDANNNKIAAFAGTNATVLTQEFTIPKGGVKLAVNCDSAYLDNFSLSIVGNPTLLSRVVALETESVNVDGRITEIDGKILDVEKQVTSTEQDIFNYNSSSLSNGYVDGYVDTYIETITTAIKYMAVSVEEGMQCTLTSVRRNLGYMYIIYDANNNKIAAFAGTNATVLTQEFTIPKGGVKLAVNCDSAYLDNFSLSIVGNPTLLSRVIELEKENVEFDVLSAKSRIVYTLGSSTIDLMKTTTNADGVKDWLYLGQLLGAKKLYNIGIGGSTWQDRGIDTDAPVISNAETCSASNQIKMLKRLVDSGNYEYPEIIFLQFTNGYSGSGTITDNMEQVMAMSFDELESNYQIRKTFYGGVRYALELLNRYFPKATYYVSDGIQCDRDLPYRRGYEYVKSGRDALNKMCDRYSCPFLETSRSIGVIDLYEHGSKTSTSNIEVLTGANVTGTIVLSLKDNNIDVSVTAGDTANVVAQKITDAVNLSNIGWAATLNGSKVLLSVAKESAAVPEFNAASTGVSVDITFNQFADDYDGIYLSTDGLHPNEKGKQLIARCVAKGILETYFEKQ